jgi:hypothetical protein
MPLALLNLLAVPLVLSSSVRLARAASLHFVNASKTNKPRGAP